MNIFILDQDPLRAAGMHCDQHLNKMILESAQMLSTACNVLVGGHLQGLYYSTHINHPCALWTRRSWPNAVWLFRLAKGLEAVRRNNYQKPHDSYEVCKIAIAKLATLIPRHSNTLTPFALAMPDECVVDDAVESYHRCYKHKNLQWVSQGKKPMQWTNRPIPFFME